MFDTDSDLQVLDNRYELGPVIGRGGMAVVHQGFDRRLGRQVAVKLLVPELASDPEARRRFQHEAQAAARVTHPGVVSVFDSGEDTGRTYMVMECMPADTLAHLLASGPLPSARVREIAVQLLGGLAAAHAGGVIHRDIKPSNVLFTPDGHAKLADFGIAKAADGGDLTRVGMLLGTPAYAAPERLSGEPATAASDVYSVGVVLYEALSGRRPFEGTDPLSIAHAVANGTPARLASLVPTVDAELAAVVDRAISKDPADRYESANEMRLALTAPFDATVQHTLPGPAGRPFHQRAEPTSSQPVVTQDVNATAVLPAGSLPQAPPRSRRMGVLALIALVVVGGLVLLFVQSRDDDPIGVPEGGTPAVPTTATAAPLPGPLEGAMRELEDLVQR